MRRLIGPALTLILMCASFAVGRMYSGAHSLPALVETLPGAEDTFSMGFDNRIRAKFPIGSSEDDLIDYLASEKFAPGWRRRDAANASTLVIDGLICQKIIRVNWRADATGVLTSVDGAYESHCL